VIVALFAVYGVLMLFIFFYSLSQLSILLHFSRRPARDATQDTTIQAFPFVTIQLPLYNEYFVAERLLDNIAGMEYPAALLEIQVLDDSTDETQPLVEEKVRYWKERGVNMVLIHRENRQGYKAGALAEGLRIAKGEFIAIFDADFMPGPLFLMEVMPYFRNGHVGMVQTRWGHLNRDYSLLTRLQSFGLDAHFAIEQPGRNAAAHFINFNGTGGVWRKSCIIDAGGWSADTLTEDLDLSYRAQLRGWDFIYLPHVVCPAELPLNIFPLKSQQFRWSKGAAECFRKNMRPLFRSELPFFTKLQGFFHLGNSFIFIAVLLTAVLSVPLLYIKSHLPRYAPFFSIGGLLFVSFVILVVFYFSAYRRSRPQGEPLVSFVWQFPAFLAVTMGLSLHNALAVAEGYLNIRTPFVRTPKFNSVGKQHNLKSMAMYLRSGLNAVVVLEFLLALYFLAAIVLAFRWREFGVLPFHVLLCFGFSFVSLSEMLYSLKNTVFKR
jgi:cellulose synthase/poly-beta-1,6-N-acetylglucosamine synthase-like glycosyltransferase